jgi:DNA helicase IV
VLRLVASFLRRGLNVVLLCRRNDVPWHVSHDREAYRVSDGLERFLAKVRRHLPEEDRRRVSASTVHSYKGREEDSVIILDAVRRSYPLIHPNWVFSRVFGETVEQIVEEERRLFYVACTRAKESLAILTESSSQSVFLDGLLECPEATVLGWEGLLPAPALDGARVEIRVFNAIEVKDQLKDLGYRWQGAGKYWHRAEMAEGFSFDALLQQPWVKERVRIDVYSEDRQLLYIR